MLYEMLLQVLQVGAEQICKGLSETKPLDAETSAFVLPIILSLLASDAEKGASLFAIHRAVSVLSNQLRLGAQLHTPAVLDCTKAVLRSQPSLRPLCAQILSIVPSLMDFRVCPPQILYEKFVFWSHQDRLFVFVEQRSPSNLFCLNREMNTGWSCRHSSKLTMSASDGLSLASSATKCH